MLTRVKNLNTDIAPGLLVAVTVGLVALIIGSLFPIIGGPVVAVLLGGGISLLRGHHPRLVPGLRFVSTWFLQIAVVLLGAKLSSGDIAKTGLSTLPLLVGTLGVCFLGGRVIGKWLGIEENTRTLITVGTGICGASAIATVAPIVAATAAQISYAMSTIFLFNVAAVLIFPLLGHLFGMSDLDFGLFAGTAVNDTSSVVAAAATFSVVAINYAVVVKLVRTLAIIPVALVLGVKHATPSTKPWYRRAFGYIPWFLIGFLLLAGLNSLFTFPSSILEVATTGSTAMITLALAAIGLSTDIESIRKAGIKPLLLGAILWILIMGSSLLLLWLF